MHLFLVKRILSFFLQQHFNKKNNNNSNVCIY